MKPRLAFSGLFFAISSLISAQEEEIRDPGVETESPVAAVSTRTPAELDQMLAPLALYPDPLIGLILPASTFPSDVVLAARYVTANPTVATFDDQSWDDSIKGLAHYPDVLKWMDENLAWTKQLGEAFAQQPGDVMSAVQRLRARAQSAGSLVNTPQQTVVTQGEEIRIVPTSAEVIYVPRYDPAVVYVESPYYYYPRPALTFSVGFAIGSWMAYDCDWRRRTVCYVRHDYRTQAWRDHCTVGYVRYAAQPRRYTEPYWRSWRPTASVRVSGSRFSSEPRTSQRTSYSYAGRADYSTRSTTPVQTQPPAGESRRDTERRSNWQPNESRHRSITNPSPTYGYTGRRNYPDTSTVQTAPAVTTPPSVPAPVTSTRPANRDANRPNRFTPPPASDYNRNYANRQSGDYAGRSRESRPSGHVSTPPSSPPPSRSYTPPPRTQPPPQPQASESSSTSQSRGASWQGKLSEAAKARSESGRR